MVAGAEGGVKRGEEKVIQLSVTPVPKEKVSWTLNFTHIHRFYLYIHSF